MSYQDKKEWPLPYWERDTDTAGMRDALVRADMEFVRNCIRHDRHEDLYVFFCQKWQHVEHDDLVPAYMYLTRRLYQTDISEVIGE